MTAPLSPWQLEVLALHLHPRTGSRYWRERAQAAGVEAADLRTYGDLARLGRFDVEALRRRPVEDFIPVEVLEKRPLLTPHCTGGATATPSWAVFSDEEFERGFIRPFQVAAAWCGFPRGGRWLFLGPTGAHPIGRAAARCARWASGQGLFSIDLDPRWARTLSPGSFARERYTAHVVAQALEILQTQEITVLFATPPVLAVLAQELPLLRRRRITGVHYGGTAITHEELDRLRESGFPEAVFLAGYGNALLGMSPQLPGEGLRYATDGERIVFRVLPEQVGNDLGGGIEVGEGERGQLLAFRFDRSFLICNQLERDTAVLLPSTDLARRAGLLGCTLSDPRPRPRVQQWGRDGLY